MRLKNWKAGWFPIEKVADRMVEPKHPAYGSQETSRRSAATLSQLQSWRNFSKPFPFVFSIWMRTFLITPYLENLLKTAFFSTATLFQTHTSVFSIRSSHNFCLIWFCITKSIEPALITGLQYLGKSLLTKRQDWIKVRYYAADFWKCNDCGETWWLWANQQTEILSRDASEPMSKDVKKIILQKSHQLC